MHIPCAWLNSARFMLYQRCPHGQYRSWGSTYVTVCDRWMTSEDLTFLSTYKHAALLTTVYMYYFTWLWSYEYVNNWFVPLKNCKMGSVRSSVIWAAVHKSSVSRFQNSRGNLQNNMYVQGYPARPLAVKFFNWFTAVKLTATKVSLLNSPRVSSPFSQAGTNLCLATWGKYPAQGNNSLVLVGFINSLLTSNPRNTLR